MPPENIVINDEGNDDHHPLHRLDPPPPPPETKPAYNYYFPNNETSKTLRSRWDLVLALVQEQTRRRQSRMRTHKSRAICCLVVTVLIVIVVSTTTTAAARRRRQRRQNAAELNDGAGSDGNGMAGPSFDVLQMVMVYAPEFCYLNRMKDYPGCVHPEEYWKSHLTIRGMYPTVSWFMTSDSDEAGLGWFGLDSNETLFIHPSIHPSIDLSIYPFIINRSSPRNLALTRLTLLSTDPLSHPFLPSFFLSLSFAPPTHLPACPPSVRTMTTMLITISTTNVPP